MQWATGEPCVRPRAFAFKKTPRRGRPLCLPRAPTRGATYRYPVNNHTIAGDLRWWPVHTLCRGAIHRALCGRGSLSVWATLVVALFAYAMGDGRLFCAAGKCMAPARANNYLPYDNFVCFGWVSCGYRQHTPAMDGVSYWYARRGAHCGRPRPCIASPPSKTLN